MLPVSEQEKKALSCTESVLLFFHKIVWIFFEIDRWFFFLLYSAKLPLYQKGSSVTTLGKAFLRIAEVETVVGMICSVSAGGDEGCIALE